MLYESIKNSYIKNKVFYTRHAKLEMENEEFGRIYEHEVMHAVSNGSIIENYPDDKPYPSCLIFGSTAAERPLHIVASYDADEELAIIITVYQPDPKLWIEYKTRRKP